MSDKINFRRRTNYESADLGIRLISERPLFYMALTFLTLLPIYLILTVIFRNSPNLNMFLLWWLKPLCEAGIVHVLSQRVFGNIPSFSGCLKTSYSLMKRPRIIGDLLWRRFSSQRATLLPITVLEKVPANKYQERKREISYRTVSQSRWIATVGIHLESILVYGILMVLGWLLLENLEHALSPNINLKNIWAMFEDMGAIFLNNTFGHIFNFIYVLVLSFWEPFFVAACFTLYLQSRISSEAWDIRLSFKELAKRLKSIIIFIGLIFILSGSLNEVANATTTPSSTQVEQTKQKTTATKPFYHIERKKVFDGGGTNKRKISPNIAPNLSFLATFIKVLAWVIGITVIAFIAYIFIKVFFPQLLEIYRQQNKENKAPSKIFGLDVREESLPENPAQYALNLFNQSPREALSLLYRALLVHLIHNRNLPIKDSMTEMEILSLVKHKIINIALSTENITNAWIFAAYAHRFPDYATMQSLCHDYQSITMFFNTANQKDKP